jgi:arylsulfate sulfotransferase
MMPGNSAIPFIFFLTVLSAVFTGCDNQHVDLHHAGISGQNGLIFEIGLSTQGISDVYAEYWIAGDTVKRYSDLSKARDKHHISIYNLIADTIYQYRISIRTGEKIRQRGINEFKTRELPEILPEFKLLIDQFDFEGYILLKPFFNPGALLFLDQQANIVWYHLYDSAVVRPFDFTPDGNILSLTDSSIIEEISLDHKLLRRIDTRDHGIDKLHHELFKTSEQSYIGLTYTERIFNLTGRGGSPADTVHGDGMVVMDSTGRKIWEWDIFDFSDPVEDDSIYRWKHDWAHANSIARDPEGNYLVSMRNLSQVWKVNAETGDVMWKLGINGDFRIEGTEWFIRQHDAHIGPDGNLLMFDNGNAQRGYSRVLSLEVDEKNFVVRPVIDIRLDDSGKPSGWEVRA